MCHRQNKSLGDAKEVHARLDIQYPIGLLIVLLRVMVV